MPAEYHSKRDPGATPEPFTGARPTGGVLFMVHHHLARSEHYDLRLEVDGCLWSWAVPKGPCPDPKVKRLAIHVEDHPLDYGFFEGVIPAGQYGAGPTIVWDRGRVKHMIDPAQGLDEGKLLFELHGYKLQGRWTLVRTKQNWLLIKERDAHASDQSTAAYPTGSVISGLAAEEYPQRQALQENRRERLHQAGFAQRWPRMPISPMLARAGDPFDDPNWIFELKYDGYRALAIKHTKRVTLQSRNGRNLAANFPEIAEVVTRLPVDDCIIDCEVCVLDGAGRSQFSLLQQRAGLQRKTDVERATITLPASAFAFDLLNLEGFDLRAERLLQRKSWLQEIIPRAGPLRYADHIEGQGQAAWRQAKAMELEGLMAKRGDSQYRAGRQPAWRKLPIYFSEAFTVVGWRPARDGSGDIGALHLAEQDTKGKWQYRGRAGSGLGEALRDRLRGSLQPRKRSAVGFSDRQEDDVAVEPGQMVQVRYKEKTRSGHLRQPVILDLTAAPAQVTRNPGASRKPGFSNLDKTFWPRQELTKGDLLDYYRKISHWMLPWLRHRPLVLVRYPDGIDGKSFFQHDAPDFAPDWITRHPVWSESEQRERNYFVVNDAESLLYLVNLGTIEFHMFAHRVDRPDRADWCVLDLDPKQASFRHVVAIARDAHRLLTDVDLPHQVKTTGQSGLHILIPTGGHLEHTQVRDLGEVLARLLVARNPDTATIERRTRLRNGKVYVDYLQNGEGKTIVAPFSARPMEAASVSMPLRWKEVTPSLEPSRYHLTSGLRRMRALADDQFVFPRLEVTVDFAKALDRLAKTQ